jgi:hypothetical protein
MSIDINHDIETLLNVGSMAKEFESSDTADEWRSAIRQYFRAERLRVRTVKYDLPEEGEDGKFIVVAAYSRTGEEVKASSFWVVANDLLNSANNSAPAATSTQGSAPGQLDWTREEIILAMDFYVTCGAISGGPIPGQHTIEIARLSTLLKKLSAYPPEVQSEKYRNTHGVYLKLMNLRAVQTGGTHGMNRISQADAAVWRDYIDNPDALHAEATAIRQRLAEGVLIPASTTAPTVEDVAIEARHTERFMSNPSGEPREAERAEAALVHRYQAHLAAKGIIVSRKRYRAGQVRPMFCDLWVQDRHALIEAKNSDSRERLRMAIGQLYDYRRFHEPPVHLAVLLPHKPRPDGLALLQSANIEAIWPHGARFRDSANGAFV